MHVIRLRGPWQRCRQDGSQPARIDVPETSDQQPGQQGTFWYRRHFHLPSGLDSRSRVYLRIDGWQGLLETASINQIPLSVEHLRTGADLTESLQQSNQISLQLAGLAGQTPRLDGEVKLVIVDDDDQAF